MTLTARQLIERLKAEINIHVATFVFYKHTRAHTPTQHELANEIVQHSPAASNPDQVLVFSPERGKRLESLYEVRPLVDGRCR